MIFKRKKLILIICLRCKKKIPVVPVSYREKIRVGRSEINFFGNIFFMVLACFFFAGRLAVDGRFAVAWSIALKK